MSKFSIRRGVMVLAALPVAIGGLVGVAAMSPRAAQAGLERLNTQRRGIVVKALTDRISRDTGKKATVVLRTGEDFDPKVEDMRGVRGTGVATISNKDRDFKYTVLVEKGEREASRVRYDWVKGNEDDDPAPLRLRRIAIAALEEEISDDLERKVDVKLETSDDAKVGNDRRTVKGRGVANYGGREREFTYSVLVDLSEGESRKTDYDWTGPAGGGNDREDLVANAKRITRNKLRARHGQMVDVHFKKADVREQGNRRIVSGTGQLRRPLKWSYDDDFKYSVIFDRAGKIVSATSDKF